jgi:hypothetical protein
VMCPDDYRRIIKTKENQVNNDQRLSA